MRVSTEERTREGIKPGSPKGEIKPFLWILLNRPAQEIVLAQRLPEFNLGPGGERLYRRGLDDNRRRLQDDGLKCSPEDTDFKKYL